MQAVGASGYWQREWGSGGSPSPHKLLQVHGIFVFFPWLWRTALPTARRPEGSTENGGALLDAWG